MTANERGHALREKIILYTATPLGASGLAEPQRNCSAKCSDPRGEPHRFQ